MTIRPMLKSDWKFVEMIYQQGIDTGLATFETSTPNWEKFDSKFHSFARLVAIDDANGKVMGWAALSPTSAREAYKGVAEVSIYISNEYYRKGVASNLLQTLIDESEAAGIWTLYASIFTENMGSIALHLKSGFREIGYRERIAKRAGVWKNNALFERRSKIVGT